MASAEQAEKEFAELVKRFMRALSVSMMEYSHRNGETEPPTVAGWYWFESNVTPLRTGVLRVYIEDNEPMVNVTFIKDGYSKHMSAASEDGQWWGPLVPPWGDNAIRRH